MKNEIDRAVELELCRRSPEFFIDEYGMIYEAASRTWIPFKLWDFQREMLDQLHNNQLNIWLKTRQIGATWLVLWYELWHMIFQPIASCLNYSLREVDARELIGDARMRGMIARLPDFIRPELDQDAARALSFGNGSIARAFSTQSGDGYTATFAAVDEADLTPNLGTLLRRVKPTIEAGGKLVLLSRSDKYSPNSEFKQLYKSAVLGQNNYKPYFVPWFAHPLRDQAWYDEIVRDSTSMDEIYEQYPSTPEEALSLSASGRVYPNFSVEQNVSANADFDKSLPVEWWVDVGWDDPTVIIVAQWVGETAHAIHEFRYTHTLDDDSIIQALDQCAAFGIPAPEQVIYDSANPSFGGAVIRVRNNRLLLTRAVGADKRMGVVEQVNHVRRHIGTGKFIINPRCDMLIRDLIMSHKSESGDGKPVHDEYSHGEAATRYGLSQTYYRI